MQGEKNKYERTHAKTQRRKEKNQKERNKGRTAFCICSPLPDFGGGAGGGGGLKGRKVESALPAFLCAFASLRETEFAFTPPLSLHAPPSKRVHYWKAKPLTKEKPTEKSGRANITHTNRIRY